MASYGIALNVSSMIMLDVSDLGILSTHANSACTVAASICTIEIYIPGIVASLPTVAVVGGVFMGRGSVCVHLVLELTFVAFS